jgi:hypothetical protein
MLRYYPSFTTLNNLSTKGNEYTINGNPYVGKYYQTNKGLIFSGPSPEIGPSEPLKPISNFKNAPGLNNINISNKEKNKLAILGNIIPIRIPGKPNSYYPKPTEEDYRKGYITRYFTKKENQNGFVIEISSDEYNSIVNGTADYDITIYQVTKILWKLTGPLKSIRPSQYNTIVGIIDTNQRLVDSTNKTFLGILEYIDGDYAKFSRPTI